MASHLVDLLVGRNLGLAYKRGLVGVLYVSQSRGYLSPVILELEGQISMAFEVFNIL
jgi:hypothetical protein